MKNFPLSRVAAFCGFFAFITFLETAHAENSKYFECVLDKMKGQPSSMQRIAQRACRSEHPIERFVTILRPNLISDGQYDYVLDRLSWSNMNFQNEELQSNYIMLSYASLPSAPYLGSLTFKYSFQECGDAKLVWQSPISVSLQPLDLIVMEIEATNLLNSGYLPKWLVLNDVEENLVALKTGKSAGCVSYTHLTARIVD